MAPRQRQSDQQREVPQVSAHELAGDLGAGAARRRLGGRKRRAACGYWSRSDAELVLVGERGRPAQPTPGKLSTSVIEGEPADRRHSSKPDNLHRIVESVWPTARKIELFARRTRPGWLCCGGDLGHEITVSGIRSVVPPQA